MWIRTEDKLHGDLMEYSKAIWNENNSGGCILTLDFKLYQRAKETKMCGTWII